MKHVKTERDQKGEVSTLTYRITEKKDRAVLLKYLKDYLQLTECTCTNPDCGYVFPVEEGILEIQGKYPVRNGYEGLPIAYPTVRCPKCRESSTVFGTICADPFEGYMDAVHELRKKQEDKKYHGKEERDDG